MSVTCNLHKIKDYSYWRKLRARFEMLLTKIVGVDLKEMCFNAAAAETLILSCSLKKTEKRTMTDMKQIASSFVLRKNRHI